MINWTNDKLTVIVCILALAVLSVVAWQNVVTAKQAISPSSCSLKISNKIKYDRLLSAVKVRQVISCGSSCA